MGRPVHRAALVLLVLTAMLGGCRSGPAGDDVFCRGEPDGVDGRDASGGG